MMNFSRANGLFALFAAALICSLSQPMIASADSVDVDFSRHQSPDLIKNKFGVYQTPFYFKTHPPRSFNMLPLLQEAGVRDLRYEFGWGKPDTFAFDQIGGTADKLVIDFKPLDPLVQQMALGKITPLFALTYNPIPLKNGTDWQRWKDTPNNLFAWSSVVTKYAEHYWSVDKLPFANYEVWNEPDLPGDGGKVFFNGSPAQYGGLYRSTAKSLKSLHGSSLSYARVGGPAVAYDMRYIADSGMLNQPLDFVSVHAYGNYDSQIKSVRAALAGRKIPIFITEYASYTDFGMDHPVSKHDAASAFFQDVTALLNYSDVTKVYWAQWIDNSLGMLTEDLHKKAIFNAYKIYQTMLPTSRRSAAISKKSGLGALAAADSSNAGVVVWNESDSDAHGVMIRLSHLPKASGSVVLYRIDKNHASWVDNRLSENLSIQDQWAYTKHQFTWRGKIDAKSVVFLSTMSK